MSPASKEVAANAALVALPIAGYALWGVKGALILGAPLILGAGFIGLMYVLTASNHGST